MLSILLSASENSLGTTLQQVVGNVKLWLTAASIDTSQREQGSSPFTLNAVELNATTGEEPKRFNAQHRTHHLTSLQGGASYQNIWWLHKTTYHGERSEP